MRGWVVALPYWNSLWNDFDVVLLFGFLLASAVVAAGLFVGRRLMERIVRKYTDGGPIQVLLIGHPHDVERVRRHPAFGSADAYAISGIFDPEILRRREGARETLLAAIRGSGAESVALCCGALADEAFEAVQDVVLATGCQLMGLGRTRLAAGSEPRVAWFRGSPVVLLTQPAWRTGWMLLKRALDFIGAAAALVVLSPLMALIAAIIKLESSGSVIFAQQRLGLGGERFRCLKFRTMRVDAEEFLRSDPLMYNRYIQNNFKIPSGLDVRVTRVGRFLRRASLDELPQFWNVLQGEMSLVGPRPIVPDELAAYGDSAAVLLSVKPGLVGAWAVNGRSEIGYPARADMELGYVRHWRVGLDLSLLARAVPVVLSRRGAH